MTGLEKSVVISGTDPSNPRSAGEILDRLGAMEKEISAMYAELGRISQFVHFVSGVLWHEQGLPWEQANESAASIRTSVTASRERLESAYHAVGVAISRISDSGVDPQQRFRWYSSAQEQARMWQDKIKRRR